MHPELPAFPPRIGPAPADSPPVGAPAGRPELNHRPPPRAPLRSSACDSQMRHTRSCAAPFLHEVFSLFSLRRRPESRFHVFIRIPLGCRGGFPSPASPWKLGAQVDSAGPISLHDSREFHRCFLKYGRPLAGGIEPPMAPGFDQDDNCQEHQPGSDAGIEAVVKDEPAPLRLRCCPQRAGQTDIGRGPRNPVADQDARSSQCWRSG